MFYQDENFDYQLAWLILKVILYQKLEYGSFDDYGYERVYEFMDELEADGFCSDKITKDYTIYFDNKEYTLNILKKDIEEYLKESGLEVSYD